MAVSDLNVHAQPSDSACTLGDLPREAVPPGVPDGAVLFPPAPGVVPMYFVWEVGGFRPLSYKLYGVFRHTVVPYVLYGKHLPIFQKWTGYTIQGIQGVSRGA